MRYPADTIYNLCQEIFSQYNYTYKTVNIAYISQIYIAEYLLGLYDEKGITKQLKRYSLDNFSKYLFYKKNILSKKENNIDNEILFFFEINNNSMIENLKSLYDYMNKKDISVKLISNNQKLLNENINNLFEFSSFFSSISNILKIKKDLKVLSRSIANHLKGQLINFNQTDFEKNLFRHFMSSIFDIDTIDAFVKNSNNDKFVLVTDVHKWSRILTIIAKKYDKKTYVLQHGATVLEYGYLPLTTDNFITWGELSKRWLMKRGADEKSIKVLGSPKFDIFFDKLHKKNSEKNHILIILNPIGKENIKYFFSIISPALKKLKLKTIIKLHPSSDDYRELVASLFNEDFFEIQKNSDTSQLINESLVVVTTTSSVAIEAILLNKPLFQIKIKGLPKMDYESYLCQHNILSSADFFKLITNEQILESRIKNYKNFVTAYCDEFSGNCKKKIARYIVND